MRCRLVWLLEVSSLGDFLLVFPFHLRYLFFSHVFFHVHDTIVLLLYFFVNTKIKIFDKNAHYLCIHFFTLVMWPLLK